MIAAVLGILLVAVAAVIGVVVGRRLADRGLMAQTPPVAFPAAIVVDEGVPAEVFLALSWAGDWWNKALGQLVFAPPGELTSGLTVMTVMADDGDFYARYKFAVGSEFSTLTFNRARVAEAPRAILRATCHELGHILGLDHDDDPHSVMYGRAVDYDFVLTAADAKIVKARLAA